MESLKTEQNASEEKNLEEEFCKKQYLITPKFIKDDNILKEYAESHQEKVKIIPII